LNHCRVVYRPSVATSEPGNVVMFYTADTGVETTEIGLSEYDAESAHQFYESNSVWASCYEDITPQNANLRYADSFNANFANDIQGMVLVEAGNNLAANKTYGDYFLEYDIEFFSPSVDYSITFLGTTTCTLKFNAFTTMTAANNVAFVGAPDGAGLGSFNFAAPPGTSEYLCQFTIRSTTIGSGGGLALWNSPDNQDAMAFNSGQILWGRFRTVGPLSWTNGATVLALYRSADSASGVVSVNVAAPSDGQLLWASTSATPMTLTLDCSVRFTPLNPNS